MAGSLFDQLKNSGLVSDKKAKQIQREKQHQARQKKANKKKKGTQANEQTEAERLVAQAAMEKAQRDQALNLQRQQQQAEKAKQAELKQIIQSNQLKNTEGENVYHFADNKIVKTLHVNTTTQQGLANEQLVIVRFNQSYAIVKADTIDKIEQRDPSVIIRNNQKDSDLSAEDEAYYAKFEIPDDLVW